MFCPNCGNDVSNDAAFCQSCGYDLKNDASSTKEDSNRSKQWYYLFAGEQKGPCSEKDIIELIEDNTIDRNTFVWNKGFSDWIQAGDTVLSNLLHDVVPATPVEAISDKWLWALAVIPLVAQFVLIQVAPSLQAAILVGVTIVLNVIFLSLDVSYLMKSGIRMETWLWLGVCLVPVYLFVRAAKTTENIVPGVVWCLLFELSFFI